jgi:ABC-type Fe3+-siderophore transport system permease subunit
MDAGEVLIPISVFAAIFGIFYVYITARNKERMAMIEKGADASTFVTKRNYFAMTLKLGMLLVGIAIGILMGSVIDEMTTLPEEVGYFSMIFLFGGIALVVNALMEKKRLE